MRGSQSKDLPPRLEAYIAALSLAGAGLVLWLTWKHWPQAPHGGRGLAPVGVDQVAFNILFFLVLTVLADLSPIKLPRGGGVTAAFAIDFSCILIYGPMVAAWVGWLSALVLMRKKPLHKIAFNGGEFALTSGLSGLAFQALGGQPAAYTHATVLTHWEALAAAGVTYIVVNNAAVATVVSLEFRRRLWGTWLAGFRWLIIEFSALAPFGVLIAMVYQVPGAGHLGVALFLLPLLWARYAFKGYTEMLAVHDKTVVSIADALEKYHDETGKHSADVQDMAERLARTLGYPETEMEALLFAARLHDIGKLVMERVLHKKEKLTDEDWQLIKRHPEEGERIVGDIGSVYRPSKIAAAKMVRQTHERPDGRGYPDGLAGNQIELGAKIIAVVDAYHAMTTDRAYRPAMDPDVALAELEKGKGTQFDERVATVFIGLERERQRQEEQQRVQEQPHAAPA